MPEHFPSNTEIYLAPQPTVVERLSDAVQAGDTATAALENVYYIDQVLGEAQHQNRRHVVYTEIHKVGESFIVTPSLESPEKHWASIGGYHSMFDAPRHHESHLPGRTLERKLGKALHLSHETIVGKGELGLDVDGQYDLTIGSARQIDVGGYNWLAEFSDNLADYPGLKATYKPLYKHVEQSLGQEALPLTIDGNVYPETVHVANERRGGIRAGIVTGVELVSAPQVVEGYDKNLQRKATLVLSAVDGHTARHQDIYNATKLERPGLFTIKMGDLEQAVSIHYVLDSVHERSNVLVIYNNAQAGKDFDDLRQMVKTALTEFTSNTAPNPHERTYIEHFENVDI